MVTLRSSNDGIPFNVLVHQQWNDACLSPDQLGNNHGRRRSLAQGRVRTQTVKFPENTQCTPRDIQFKNWFTLTNGIELRFVQHIAVLKQIKVASQLMISSSQKSQDRGFPFGEVFSCDGTRQTFLVYMQNILQTACFFQF